MKIKQLEKEIGTLSNPSKMPAYAWGISAKKCKVGSKLAKIKEMICLNCASRVATERSCRKRFHARNGLFLEPTVSDPFLGLCGHILL